VSPDGNCAARGDTEWADATDGTDPIETFVTTQLIAAVEGTNPRPRELRAIAGFSMGGYAAANIAEHRPDLYGQVVSLAGYFHVDDPDGVFANPAAIDANSPDRHLDKLQGEHVALIQGEGDAERPEAGEAIRFSTLLDNARIANTLAITPGGHGWAWAAQQTGTWAKFLAEGWPAASGSG